MIKIIGKETKKITFEDLKQGEAFLFYPAGRICIKTGYDSYTQIDTNDPNNTRNIIMHYVCTQQVEPLDIEIRIV